MDSKVCNVAIAGCGSMGVENLFDKSIPFVYSFAGAVFQNPRTKLVALVDTDRTKLSQVVERLQTEGYPTDLCLCTSLAEAVTSCDEHGKHIDLVCCAAGPEMNRQIIGGARDWGVKAVYCEKPLSLSLTAADEMAQIETDTGLVTQVNYLRNFERCHMAVLKYIREDKLGDLLTVRVNYKGGVLAVAPHALALLQLLFGLPRMVIATTSPLLNGRCPDDPNVDGILRYQYKGRGVNASIMATGRGDPLVNNTYIFELEFTGTKGRISILENGWRIRYERMETSRVFEMETMPYETASVPLGLRSDNPREFMVDGLAQVLAALNQGEKTTANVSLVRDAEEVAHALALSANEGGVVSLPLTDREHAFKDSRAGVKLLRHEAGTLQK